VADILAKTYTMIKAIKFKGGDSTIPETIDHIRVEGLPGRPVGTKLGA